MNLVICRQKNPPRRCGGAVGTRGKVGVGRVNPDKAGPSGANPDAASGFGLSI